MCNSIQPRRDFLCSLGSAAAAVLPWPLPGHAQQASGGARIGWLTAQQAASLAAFLEAFKAGLVDLGRVEGSNLRIEYRFGNDAIDRVPQLARLRENLPVDLVVAQGAAVAAISKMGLKVPVVYVSSADPVAAGLADSLAQPRGNMTGLTFMAAELNGKRLELLREIAPSLQRIAIIANPEHPGSHLERAYSEEAADRLGLSMAYFPTTSTEELSAALAAMASDPPQGISVFADGFAIQNRRRIIEFGMSIGAPVTSGWAVFAKSGALCTYGPQLSNSYRRLAHFVDRVLKGAKPAELPIERPTKFELVLNNQTARKLGLTLPHSLLVRADEVIE